MVFANLIAHKPQSLSPLLDVRTFLLNLSPSFRTTGTGRALMRRENWVRGDREKGLRNHPSGQRYSTHPRENTSIVVCLCETSLVRMLWENVLGPAGNRESHTVAKYQTGSDGGHNTFIYFSAHMCPSVSHR